METNHWDYSFFKFTVDHWSLRYTWWKDHLLLQLPGYCSWSRQASQRLIVVEGVFWYLTVIFVSKQFKYFYCQRFTLMRWMEMWSRCWYLLRVVKGLCRGEDCYLFKLSVGCCFVCWTLTFGSKLGGSFRSYFEFENFLAFLRIINVSFLNIYI